MIDPQALAPMVSVREACEIASISRKTLARLLKSGAVRSCKLGDEGTSAPVRVVTASLLDYLGIGPRDHARRASSARIESELAAVAAEFRIDLDGEA